MSTRREHPEDRALIAAVVGVVLIVALAILQSCGGPRYELVRCYVERGAEPVFEGVLRRDGKTLMGHTVDIPSCAICTRQPWEPRGGGRY